MNNKTLYVFALALAGLALPISNMLGFSGENKPIPVVSGSSERFAKVSEIFQKI